MRLSLLGTASDPTWLPSADIQVSAHFDQRRNRKVAFLVVLHGISIPKGVFGGSAVVDILAGRGDSPELASLTDDQRRVSAHFLIRRRGELVQFVPLNARSWHAGKSVFRGQHDCNDFSIGIELEGEDNTPYTDYQYRQLNGLLMGLKTRLPLTHITTHSVVSPGRKTDPGPAFSWHRLDPAVTASYEQVRHP